MNLRQRLSLWYSLILFVSLFAAGMAGYSRIRQVLLQQFDRELSDEMILVNKIYLDEKGEKTLDQFRQSVSEMDFHYAIFDTNHTFLMGSEAVPRTFPEISAEERMQAESGATLFLQTEESGAARRIILQRAGDLSGDLILLDEPLDQIDYVMVRLRAAALVLMALFLILAVTGGWWMAGRALAPIEEVMHTATQIQESNMSLRIASPDRRDEVGRLIVTLNSMLDRIESSFKQIRRFTQDAAHELRTPLSCILSAVDVTLRRRDRTADEYREALEAVRDETMRLQKLSEDLLTLARAEHPASSGRSDPALVCKRVMGEMKPLVEARRLICDVRVLEGAVSINEDALARVIRNLLDNAVKFSPEGATIRIEGVGEGDASASYKFEVTDSGPGIAGEDLPNVFERFYRGANAGNSETPGSGLGLSIALALARQAGGDVSAENVAPHGARFCLRLPVLSA